jgi:hypothetical protein
MPPVSFAKGPACGHRDQRHRENGERDSEAPGRRFGFLARVQLGEELREFICVPARSPSMAEFVDSLYGGFSTANN